MSRAALRKRLEQVALLVLADWSTDERMSHILKRFSETASDETLDKLAEAVDLARNGAPARATE